MVRAERSDEAAFREVFASVLRRLEGLSEAERVRWHDLLWFVLSWGLRRRPRQERETLQRAAEGSQSGVAHRKEVKRMSDTIGQTWEQEMLANGELRARREDLQLLLEERFGPLPEGLAQRIEAINDLNQLRTLFRQALRVTSLAELEL